MNYHTRFWTRRKLATCRKALANIAAHPENYPLDTWAWAKGEVEEVEIELLRRASVEAVIAAYDTALMRDRP